MTLDSPRTIRILIRICLVGLVLLAGLDFFFTHHAHFKHQGVMVDAWPFFYPIYGFVTCVAMVWGSKKLLSTVLMRPEIYYHEDGSESDDEGLLADHASEQEPAGSHKDGA